MKATVLAFVRCGKALAPNTPWRYTALTRLFPGLCCASILLVRHIEGKLDCHLVRP